MLLDNARDKGADVREGARVAKVRFAGDRAVGVTAVIDGETQDIDARVVVDASGQTALLGRQLNLMTADAHLKKGAIYAHFKGGHRDPGRDEGATLIIHTRDSKGWFWYIPLPEDIVSVGLVSDPHGLFAGRGDDPGATFREEIALCEPIMRRLAKAEQISRTHVTSDFSYRASRVAGDGWVLVGDAFGFLDPVYSSGVFLALRSGELAADAIHEALADDSTAAARLGRFGKEYARGMSLLRNLVYAFYDRDFSIGRFTKQHPEYRDHIVRLLIGDVFNHDVGAVFGPMAAMCELPDAIVVDDSTGAPPAR
jgi:flavin-dependent dehydrogenase